jgi:osmotically-inducible protein OsmY
MRSTLRLGCPVRFRDRWQGRLKSFQVDEEWLVLNLAISRGVFRPSEVKLPFSTASDWDDDGIFLDCTSDEAFGREIPPLAVPAMPLSAGTPLSVGDASLVGAVVERSPRRASHLLLSRGLLASQLRMVPVAHVSLEGGVVRLATQAKTLPPYRRDSDLVDAVRAALAAHRYLTADDRRTINVEVVDGTAYVSGNVRTSQAQAYVREAASSVPGLAAVRSDVIDDRQLEIDVARALDAAGLFRNNARIYVRAALGEVTLGGFLTAAASDPEILRVAQAVPGVRAVEDRMEVQEAAPPAAAAPPTPPAEPEPAPAAQGEEGA